MQDSHFDKLIKEKLEGLQLNSEQAGWSVFADKYADILGGDTPGDIPENGDVAGDPFDAIIKDKLAGLSSTPAGADWSTFESKFGDQIKSQDFDEQMRDSLGNYSVPFKHSHWELLKARLEDVLFIRQTLFTSKTLEVVMALLLFLTAYNNMHLLVNTNPAPALAPIAAAEANDIEQTRNAKSTSDALIASAPKVISETENISVGSNEVAASTTTTNRTNSGVTSKVNIEKAELSGTDVIQEIPAKRTFADASGANPPSANGQTLRQSNEVIAASTIIKNDTQSTGSIVDTDKINNTTPQRLSIEKINPLLTNLNLSSTEAPTMSLMTSEVIKPSKSNTNALWFHTVMSTDHNMITSSFDTPIGEEDYATTTRGYSAGIKLGYEFGNLGISTGLLFGNYSYTPKANEEEYLRVDDNGDGGYYSISLREVEHNTLNVPLNLDYKFFNPGRWTFYGSVGANLNLITYTSYEVFNELVTPIPDNVVLPATWEYPTNFAGRNYIRGYNQGGSFDETASLYLNLGVGIQRNFGNALSLYAQPNYQHHLINTSIDPNGDQINRLSMTAGLKFKMEARRSESYINSNLH